MIKHVGKHNNKKVVVLYREVPDEQHMALVTYTETLPALIHDELMQVVDSITGQKEHTLADAAFRHTMGDGQNCLQVLHARGYMKKVPTNQIIMTPDAKNTVRLDELNKIINEIAAGTDAAKRMEDLDVNSGFRKNSATTSASDVANTGDNQPALPGDGVNTNNSFLTEDDLQQRSLEQAAKMRNEAEVLLAEAARLEQEAAQFAPGNQNDQKAKSTKRATRATKPRASTAKKPTARKTTAKKSS